MFMHLQCNRFIFPYKSSPETVKDYILRSDDLAKRTYGRDIYFSRLNQVLDFARFLGWDIPRFGANMPEEFTDIPDAGIDHIFENQAKLLVDIAPVTRVMLENGKYCPIRMVCGTTPAGDLVWRTHLLVDKEGCPYIIRKGQRHKAKTKGTQIVCQSDTLVYDEQYIVDCFGGPEGVFPVPFLPEFFSDRPVAHFFSPEAGVIEVVTISESEPVRVLATDIVPWYRLLELDRTKALPLEDDYAFEEEPYEGRESRGAAPIEKRRSGEPDPNALVSGWDGLSDGEQFDFDDEEPLDEEESLDVEDYDDFDPEDYDEEYDGQTSEDVVEFTNVVVNLSAAEQQNLQAADDVLSKANISTKQEAEELRKDPKEKDRADKWLLSAVNRLQILSNSSAKMGALVSLLQKHREQQVLVIQPRQKWASQLAGVLKQQGFTAELLGIDDKTTLRRFYDGSVPLLVASNPLDNLFIDDLVIILVSSFDAPSWLDYLSPSQTVYSISIAQLGYLDFNLVSEHPRLMITMESYEGPVLDVLKLTEVAPKKRASKYNVKISKGRAKKFATYEKAMEFVKKQELQAIKCEVYPPDSNEATYITGIGEVK